MKDITEQQVAQHIRLLNPWWDKAQGLPNAKLKPRAYMKSIQNLITNVDIKRAVVLLGARRVGKTVLIHHLINDLIKDGNVPPRNIIYAEMDHPLLHGQSLESILGIHETAASPTANGTRFAFFDEIQYLNDWERELKSAVDHHPGYRILVSGSAAAALKRKSTESGAGRFTDFLLPPLTFSEYLEIASDNPAIEERDNGFLISSMERLNQQFIDYINYGGYPELALSPDVRESAARFIKSDIVEKVLLRDLPQLYGIQNIQELNSLFTLLAYNTGEEVSPDALSQRCGIKQPTIMRYIEYLEAAFLLQRVFRVDQDGKKYKRQRNFKIHLTNPSMRSGLFGPMQADDEGIGHLVETAVFSQRFHKDISLNYARWGKKDREVDMIELDQILRPVEAIEIKWSDAPARQPRDSRALVDFCRKNKLSAGIVGTHSTQFERHDAEVKIVGIPVAALAYVFGLSGIKRHVAEISETKIFSHGKD